MSTSQHQHITYNLDEACRVTKSDLKTYVTTRLGIVYPEGRALLTKRLVGRTLIYLEGYSNRLKEEMTPPVNISDVKNLLLSEGFRYIWNRIDRK